MRRAKDKTIVTMKEMTIAENIAGIERGTTITRTTPTRATVNDGTGDTVGMTKKRTSIAGARSIVTIGDRTVNENETLRHRDLRPDVDVPRLFIARQLSAIFTASCFLFPSSLAILYTVCLYTEKPFLDTSDVFSMTR